ncbi:MAG: glutamine amidotransferase [Leptolyngbyaceae cyanobacterium CSU_1_4]|nr:glutamine amidotransferase [Leptolyngbyaceae cyanobacterium CSU_1_4]
MRKILLVVHQVTSEPGLIGQVLQDLQYDLEICCPAVAQPLPSTLEDYEGAIVLGGPMSANDDTTLPFIRDELNWIPLVLEARKPYLGVCLGAQLLARVLGGQVSLHPDGIKEIGYSKIQPVSEQAELLGLTHVYHWHQEGFEVPREAILLAEGQVFPNQAFRYGKAYGIQFHPEITHHMIRRWVAAAPEAHLQSGAPTVEAQLHQHLQHATTVEHWLRGFLRQWLCSARVSLDVAG